MNIGNVYSNQGKHEKALKSYQDALATFIEIGNPLGKASAIMNIGTVYRNRGKLEESLKYYQDARVIFLNIGAVRELQIVTRNIEQLNTAMK